MFIALTAPCDPGDQHSRIGPGLACPDRLQRRRSGQALPRLRPGDVQGRPTGGWLDHVLLRSAAKIPKPARATGAIKGGSYTLSTIGGDDGAFPGDYIVAIASKVPDMSTAKTNSEKSGGTFRQDDVAKAFKKAESVIPKKYESTETSGLKAKVEAHSNKIDFPLSD